jgi:NADH-quinone oxidoreductase subunit H
MNPFQALLALLIFPGLAYAVPMGWLMLGSERKLRARFQCRIGPPITQPFWDTVKLLAKWPAARVPADMRIFSMLALLAVGSAIGALALLPVSAGESGFAGDLILLVTLLEIPPLCLILAGYASRSIYGEVGATREAVVSIAANVPFLSALIAMATAAGSLHVSVIATGTPWSVRLPAMLAIMLCLPVKLRINPVSLANAEQEVLAGPLTEFDGRLLALWELAHALEWVALSGFVVTLAAPFRGGSGAMNGFLFVVASFALVPLLTLLASATARLKLAQATRLLWRWASTSAALALIISVVMRRGGR